MKSSKKILIGSLLAAMLISGCVGTVQAVRATSSVGDITQAKFELLQATSVRMGAGTEEDPTGLRFQTIAADFKAALENVYPTDEYSYQWYTEIRFKKWEGETYVTDKAITYKSYTTYERCVDANVWHETGWNTVLLNIPYTQPDSGFSSNLALDVTAQSYVKVIDRENGGIAYQAETKSLTYSAAKTASHVLARGGYKTEEEKQLLLGYVNNAIECGDLEVLNLPRTEISVLAGTCDWLETSTFPSGYGVTYISADPSIARVDADGRVTGVKSGTTVITVSVGSLSKICMVSVKAANEYPKAYTSWTSNTYPMSQRMSVSGGKISVDHVGMKTPVFSIDSTYAQQVFGLSAVKALRIKITNFPEGYYIQHFITNYNRKSGALGDYDTYTSFKQEGNTIWLQINRGAYEYYLDNRLDGEEFVFRCQYGKTGGDLNDVVALPAKYTIESITPIYDDVTLDFEDRAYNDSYVYASSYVQPVADRVEIARVQDRTMGRGNYSLLAEVDAQSMTINVSSTYVNKVFASGAVSLQFRVYTAVDISRVLVNGSTANVQYVYHPDGEYYIIRVGNAYNGKALTITIESGAVLGEVYLDAFTASEKAVGVNRSMSQAYAADNGGEPKFELANNFRFYAYSSVSDGLYLQEGEYIDMNIEMEESRYTAGKGRPTVESFQELKDAGFYAIMPQTAALVGQGTLDKNGNLSVQAPGSGIYDYRDVLDVAQEVGLKVILTDNLLLFASQGASAMSNAMYTSELDENGAGKPGTALYNFIKGQLLSYANHPAFYGVLLRDEPMAWMLDKNMLAPEGYKPGSYGLVYRTIVRVAEDLQAVWNAASDKQALIDSGKAYLNKDVYIHANLIGATTYTGYSSHVQANTPLRYPELTRERYCEILNISLTQSYADIGGKNPPASLDTSKPLGELSDVDFYGAIEAYINVIGTTGGHENIRRDEARFALMRERFAAYCQLFIDATGAKFLMPDFYPLYSEGPMDNYLMALQTAAEVARANNVDLYIVTQTQSYVPGNSTSTRILSDADVRFLNNTLLSFGVKNMIYFTYGQHGDDNAGFFHDGSSFAYMTGEKTPIWYYMQQLMAENQAFASTYQSFELRATKSYYSPLALQKNGHAAHAKDVLYDASMMDNSVGKQVDVQFAGVNVAVDGVATIVSEFENGKGAYMYSVMNVIDPQFAATDAYQSVTLTFETKYTHVILWRNGVKKLVALDENNSITVENGAGEAVFLIAYQYSSTPGHVYDNNSGDNGSFFPGSMYWKEDEWLRG